MNGKIKTKFAALFAVALMITVCVVPVVDNAGVDAAPVSSSNGEVFEGYELKLFTEGMDNYDDLVYYGTVEDAGVNAVNYNFIEIGTVDSKDVGYLVSKETGLFLRYGDIPNYTVWFDLPIVQFTYVYSQAAINEVDGTIVVKQGTSQVGEFTFNKKTNLFDNNDPRNEGIVTFGLYNGLGSDHLSIAQAMAAGNFDVEITATQGVTQQVIKQTINAGPAVTVSGQITDADGKGIQGMYSTDGISYKKTEKDGKFTFNVVPGTVVNLTVKAQNYTFTVNDASSDTTSWNFGNVNAPVSKTFKANEKTGTIAVQDADGNPLSNKTVNLKWYTQVAVTTTTGANNETTTKYNFAAMTATAPSGVVFNNDFRAGTATPSVVTDEKGIASFAYTLPEGTVKEYNATYSSYAYALVASGSPATGESYTFDVVTPSTNSLVDLQSLIASKAGMADAQYGSATINAEQTIYKISGTVEGYSAKSVADNIVSYKLSTGNNYLPVNLQKDGTFAFYLTEGMILSDVKIATVTTGSPSNVTVVFNADLYTDKDVSIGTIYQDVVVDFKLKPVDAPEAPVSYQVAIKAGEKVSFSYSIDGVKYTANLPSVNGFATLSFTAKIGAVIEISATAENYDISAFDGYKASAVEMTTRYVQVQADGEPVPGATFKVLYTYGTEKLSMDLTADDKGFANFTIPADSKEIKIAKGTQVENLPSSTKTDYDSGIEYSIVSLSAYEVETSNIEITYASVYNSDTVLAAPVAGAEIAPGKELIADVGESISLKAPSIDNFEFVAWMVDGVVVSEKADYTLVVPAHDHDSNESCEAVALYSAVHYEEPAEGLSMNVLVIGIVILILGILAVAYGIISKKQ